MPTVPSKAETRPVVFLFEDEFDSRVASILEAHEPSYRALVRQVLAWLGKNGSVTGSLSTLAFQTALVKLWAEWGISPHAVLGNGVGAVAAACVAEAQTLPTVLPSLDALRQHNSGKVFFTNLPATHTDAGIAFETKLYPIETACRILLDLHPNAILLPIGSAGDLSSRLTHLIDKSTTSVLIRALEQQEDDRPAAVLEQAAALWKLGASFEGTALYKGETRGRIPLPAYPLKGERHWWTGRPSR
jgi:acyl transferase domain-containing protein